jgi:predicted nuclease of predicted toxin-antitoxin system
MAKLYSEEDFTCLVVEVLRQLGHDVLTAQESGQGNLDVTDSSVLAFAFTRDRAVLTFNRRHFINPHRQVSSHRGILVCTRDNDVQNLARRIHQAVFGCPSLDNQLLRINRPQSP